MKPISCLRMSCLFALLAMSSGEVVLAHEVRPAFLGLTEIETNTSGEPSTSTSESTSSTFDVVWKQPLLNDKRLRLDPVFPQACTTASPVRDEVVPGALIRTWQLRCLSGAFSQQPISIRGLSSTLTDVWVNVRLRNGKETSSVLKPSQPSLWLNQSQGARLSAYLTLGIEHLLLGFDHILFVMGLMFFVRGFSSLLKTATAFTVAHSITLAASSLNWVHLSQAPVEAAIALSILFLAFEASLPNRDKTLTARMPWLVAFVFGLLHGFGFAGALRDIGLPDATAALALLLFNMGVEIGQVLVIGGLLSFLFLISRWIDGLPRWLVQSPMYAMGALSAFWFFQRLAPIIGL